MGHVAYMGEAKCVHGVDGGTPKEGDHWEDISIDKRVICNGSFLGM
jgi:hypothetical protein